MIVDSNRFKKSFKEKRYILAVKNPCEHGTEGWSCWSYVTIASGETDEENYLSWIEQCKTLYGVDLSEDFKIVNGKPYVHYYEVEKNKIIESVSGHLIDINVLSTYRKHDD